MIVTIVLIVIVVIVLAIYFIAEFIAFRKANAGSKWPPWGRPLRCPDYWVDKGNNVCANPHKLGTGYPSGSKPINEFNMNNFPECVGKNYNSKACLKAKCKFAQTSNNPWFGVQPDCRKTGKCYCPF